MPGRGSVGPIVVLPGLRALLPTLLYWPHIICQITANAAASCPTYDGSLCVDDADGLSPRIDPDTSHALAPMMDQQ